MLKYLCISFDGAIFPVAHHLIEEGQTVWVCQIENGKDIGGSWVSDEDKEAKKRRMSLYDGIFNKHELKETLKMMEGIKDKSEWFFLPDHNSLYPISEKALKMGFEVGAFPTEEDYEREKDRMKSKEFVKLNYPGIVVDEVKEMKGVDKAIEFIRESDEIWCVKSDGNYGETIVPDKDDPKLAKEEVIAELERQKKDMDKGGLLLEPKIPQAFECAPQMAFWNGKPIYSTCEFETRMLGAADIGPQTGGNENIVMNTPLDCELNKIAFPEAMMTIAKHTTGLFLADAGLLYDGSKFHFTEFAGNRWGWGGIFSEMAGTGSWSCKHYFESVAKGKNPYRYKFASSLALYNMKEEKDYPKGDLPVILPKGKELPFFMYQVKMGENKQLVNVGYRSYESAPLGYVTASADTINDAAELLYEYLKDFSFKGVYYRPLADFLATDYHSAIPVRYNKIKQFLGEEKRTIFGSARPKASRMLS
jgi:phosphoribosylamine-glycine ligase